MSPRHPRTTVIPPVCSISSRWSRFTVKLLQSSSVWRGGLSRKQRSCEVREGGPSPSQAFGCPANDVTPSSPASQGSVLSELVSLQRGHVRWRGVALILLRQGWESWMTCSVWSLVLWEYDTKPGFQAGRSGRAEDAGKDWRQEEKGTAEDEMVGWHHQLDRHAFEHALGFCDGQGSLACCSPWGRRVGHDWVTELKVIQVLDSQRVFVSGTGMQGVSLDREAGRLFRILEASNGGENSKRPHKAWIIVQLDLKDACSAWCGQSVLEGVCPWGTHIGGRDCSPAAACHGSLITPRHITAFSHDSFWAWGPGPMFSALWPPGLLDFLCPPPLMKSSCGQWWGSCQAVLPFPSLVAQTVKNPPAMWETWVWSLCWEDLLEKGMAAHSSSLAWRIPWAEEPGGLQSMGSQRVGH